MAEAGKDSPLSIFSLIAVMFAVVCGFNKWDSWGLDSHDAESTITAQANWIVGESKYRTSRPMEATDKHKAGYALDFVNCDEGPGHLVKITFWGREEQPEYFQVNWKCVRNAGHHVIQFGRKYRIVYEQNATNRFLRNSETIDICP